MELDETWRKATKSNNNGACALVRKVGDFVQLRDSKVPGDQPAMTLTLQEWDAFQDGVRKGEFVAA